MAPLWRANLHVHVCFVMDRVESQVDAPFSLETVIALCILLGSLSVSNLAVIKLLRCRIV